MTATDAVFDDEPKKPSVGNLATHLRDKHEGASPPDSAQNAAKTANDAEIMRRFLLSGAENPSHDPTQVGLNTVFAAWVLEDDLPFTLGESDGLDRVRRYLDSQTQVHISIRYDGAQKAHGPAL